jgi:catechol 2,3-dioxygenase-like lactoylglutathione lyase family enzyme
MTGERTYPVLPCADLDDALDFYIALGFNVTFEQHRPYACAVVELDEIAIHLFALDGFDPETSYGSAIITVAEPAERHEAFKAGLRKRFGKVPIKGIPRLLPRGVRPALRPGFRSWMSAATGSASTGTDHPKTIRQNGALAFSG